MDIDPKKCGQCWSCQFCEDVGEFRYEDDCSYMRKCAKVGHEYVDLCQTRCPDYVWNGTSAEFWKLESAEPVTAEKPKPAAPVKPAANTAPKDAVQKGVWIGLGVLAVVFLILVGVVIGMLGSSSGNPPAATTVTTAPQTFTATVVTQQDDLYLRSAPGKDAKVITSIPKGATVTVMKQEGDWSYVDYKGTLGWCASQYLQ